MKAEVPRAHESPSVVLIFQLLHPLLPHPEVLLVPQIHLDLYLSEFSHT